MASEPTLDELIAWVNEGQRHLETALHYHADTNVRTQRDRTAAIGDALRRLRARETATARVRAIHQADISGACGECEQRLPCPTLRALDAGGGA
jgi:hypothetical protein